MAPTFGPDPDDLLELLMVAGAAEVLMQIVCWQESQVGGTSEQI
jgi:hypothetical protein